ncbi:M48 family metalloprotease [Chiayiivirga flava]|uniref:Putative Zn-dependent protease n=1 Tax=Chiayiivirga flava TaxID=659595 RepID=A0A7W8D7Q5_9GAMM|nr:M48 family metalloprotease [Chiayiivirga flava]MBB5208201.1 putative Zn-dependent protease [Chiayiivirga flava]
MLQQERALLASPARVDDAALLGRIERVLCRLDAVQCRAVRVVVLDLPGLRCELVGARLLRVHRPLLDALAGEDALAFVLGHELAHRTLAHVQARRRFGWDSVAGEIAADAEARRVVVAAGFRDVARDTLVRLREVGDYDDAGLDARIDALASSSRR